MSYSRIRALLVYVHYPEHQSYFDDWRDAFRWSAELDVVAANLAMPWGRARLRQHVDQVDLVVLLHSVIGDSLDEIRRCERDLQRRRAPLLAFIGNEVSLPTQPIAAKLQVLRELAPEFIGTQLTLEAGEYLYETVPGARVLPLPHALNPAVFRPRVPGESRPIDIGFRGARYLPEVGDNDRNRMIDFFAGLTDSGRLVVDVETGFTLDRVGWCVFLNQCRATIGVESGSYFLTPDDQILREVAASSPPATTSASTRARALTRYLPRAVKDPFRRSLTRRRDEPAEPTTPAGIVTQSRPPVYGKCISSRHFDAIGTETCQIMFPGRYNDLLEADRHYLSLEPDFSNLDDVLQRLRDETHRGRLVSETRQWALDAHTYRHRVNDALAEVMRAA